MSKALELLQSWMDSSALLFVMSIGSSASVKAMGRVTQVDSLAATISWDEYGTLVLPLVGVTFDFPTSPEYVSALAAFFPSGDRFALFELLDRNFMPDTLPF